ncbi:HEAT repeat domain-containing protein [Jiella pacifica]|uniref:HEAT repeat domain-containing protein n=1 Tax=Jiella pacifica TaxID=2696469 RepID=A0A6N9T2R1_9HYPH|nr:HEAT repeat domain-containing protein [Jiella pacifica]NDW04159.1 hypothetical protein [Jiella pacifica]
MYRIFKYLMLSIFALAFAASASAVTLEDLDRQINRRATTLEAFRQRLNDDNPAKRRAAMEIMIKSDDPALVRMAKEAGLFSSDRALRSAALKAIFDSKPRLRTELTSTDKESLQGIARFVAGNGGSYDDKGGTLSFQVGAYSDEAKCWLDSRGRFCLIALSGETVSIFGDSFSGSLAATLTLNDEGLLKGPFQTSINAKGASGTAMIDLTE